MKDLHLNPDLLTVPAYVGGRPIEEVQAEYGLSDVVKLASNENPLGPSPLGVAAFQEALKSAHRYPGIADKQLRQKLAAHYNARFGTSFTERNFLTGNGLSDILRMIALGFLHAGGESIYCNPTFPLYGIFTRMFGGTPVPVPHADYRYNLRGMGDAITDRTRVIFVCNPNNPTGTTVSRDEVAALMARVPASVVVVFDESYYDFVDDPQYSNALEYVQEGRDQVVCLRGFSKAYGMANLRIGYMIATPDMVDYLAHAQISFNTGDATLRAATAALDDRPHVEAARQLMARERPFLYDAFAELELKFVPTQANFILLVDLPLPVQAINEGLLRRGVIVRPMGGFGMPDAIRVTIGTHAENVKFVEMLKQVLDQ
ncbi:MAG: histidinol-phosphate transaminase [Chloroflexi bacterium]|nr:histidinol-phosphate transaminase [Chloroflexota bacterium]